MLRRGLDPGQVLDVARGSRRVPARAITEVDYGVREQGDLWQTVFAQYAEIRDHLARIIEAQHFISAWQPPKLEQVIHHAEVVRLAVRLSHDEPVRPRLRENSGVSQQERMPPLVDWWRPLIVFSEWIPSSLSNGQATVKLGPRKSACGMVRGRGTEVRIRALLAAEVDNCVPFARASSSLGRQTRNGRPGRSGRIFPVAIEHRRSLTKATCLPPDGARSRVGTGLGGDAGKGLTYFVNSRLPGSAGQNFVSESPCPPRAYCAGTTYGLP